MRFFVIGIVAVFAPLLTRLPAFARMPAVVLELLLGILIGPSGLGWVTSQGAIGFLGEFGLIFLFFQAGFEFNPEEIGAVPLRLGAIAWLAAFGLSVLFASVLLRHRIVARALAHRPCAADDRLRHAASHPARKRQSRHQFWPVCAWASGGGRAWTSCARCDRSGSSTPPFA